MRDLRSPSLAVLAFALAGCFSGGDSNDSLAEEAVASPPPKASVSGAVTGFGSVFVGGERYETDGDTVYAVEGESEVRGRQDRVALGMKVRVIASGQAGERRAVRVEIDDDLRGPVSSVSAAAANPAVGSLVVLGQEVLVDDLAVFGDDVVDANDDGAIDLRDLDPAIATGSVVVEISGYATEKGLLATRIERLDEADDDEVEVKGFVDTVAVDGTSFTINGATFNVDGGTFLEDGLVVDQTLVGRFIEVEAVVQTDGSLRAVELEAEDDEDTEEGEAVEIEGLLQSLDLVSTPNVAVIAGRTLKIVDAARLEGLVGLRVEIKATAGADGVLTLTGAKTEVGNTVEVRDEVVSVDLNGGGFTTRLGLRVAPTGDSRVQDKVDKNGGDKLEVEDFLRRLRPGDRVRAKGRPGANGADSVSWTKIERRREGDDRCTLKGPVDTGSLGVDRFSILGVTVNTVGLDDDGFELEDAEGRTAFFDSLGVGVVVKAKSGTASDCQVGAILLSAEGEVELDDDDDVKGSEDDRDDDDRDDDADDNDDDDDRELVGTVRGVDASALTFQILERTVTVTPTTIFDDDLLRARGIDTEEDLNFADTQTTLDELLVSGDRVEIELGADGKAVEIELAD